MTKWVLGFFVGGVFLWATFEHLQPLAQSEPDLYFQLAISKRIVQEGQVKSFPQLVELGWDKSFPDKNWFFNQLTATTYRLGGEKLTQHFPFLVSLLLLASLCYFSKSLWAIGLFFTSPIWLSRMVLLRPHILAVLIFFCGLVSLLRSSLWGVGLSAFLFGWSYHAFYLPVALAGCFFLFKRDRNSLRLLLLCILGVIMGLRFNPAFPGNVQFALTNLRIALNYQTLLTPGVISGLKAFELVPVNLVTFLERHGLILGLLVLAGIQWTKAKDRFEAPTPFLLTIAAILWLGSWFSPRLIEYAWVVSAYFLVGHIKTFFRRPIPGVSVLAAGLFLLYLPTLFEFYFSKVQKVGSPDSVLAALREIPKEAAGKKVFNCEWASGPYILYQQPQLRFVDLWGPYLLAEADPNRHRIFEYLRQGKIREPYWALKEVFGADYVLCMDPRLVIQMEGNPQFTRLFPKIGKPSDYQIAGFPFLYQLAQR